MRCVWVVHEGTGQPKEGRSQTPLTIATDRVPIGPWSKDPREKEIGKYNLLNLMEGMVRTCPASHPQGTRKAD